MTALIIWVICIMCLTYKLLKKVVGYVYELQAATGRLFDKTGDYIELSPELSEIAVKINHLKQEAENNAKLAQENEQRKNDLIMYLAHDLKTPLSSVIGYLTLLRDDEQQIPQELRNKYLSISLDKAEQLEDLINEFFEITRFNLSNITLKYSDINLTRLLEQLIYEFNPMLGKVSENEIKSPVDGTVISATNSSEIIPNNYPVATVRYTGFALNVEAENFLKTLPENTTLKAKFQVINGVGPTDILAVVTPATEYAEGSSTNTLFPQSNVLQCLIDKDTDVKIGQNATVVITAGTKENILLLPLSVIAGRQGKGMVTVIKDGEQIQTEVTLGATDGAYIEILSGVEEGDVVSSVPPNLDPRSNS